MITEELTKQLEEIEKFIWENEESFLEFLNLKNAELMNIWFGARNAKVYYLFDDYQHVTDTISNEKLLEFLLTSLKTRL
jgi:hypothetical protein